MGFIVLVFGAAIAISSVAAYFSLVGLGALFAATFWGVVVMAGSLEAGKIIVTKWVHSNWRNPAAPWYFRTLLCFFIAVLMTITSLGIYGYLSKGHLEQQAPVEGAAIQISQLENQIQQKESENRRLESRIEQISRTTDRLLDQSGRAGLRGAAQQRRESQELQEQVNKNYNDINEINTQLVDLKISTAENEAKLGPLKYVAELFGWEPDKAVRIIIVLIMLAFDPLALSLFIAGSISLRDHMEKKKSEKSSIVEPFKETKEVVLEKEVIPEEKFREDRNEELEEAWGELTLEKVNVEMAKSRIEDSMKSLEIKEAILNATEKDLIDLNERLSHREDELNTLQESLANKTQQLQEIEDLLRTQAIEAIDAEDTRSPKEKIIDQLEKHPEIINDIVQIVMAKRKERPGI